MYSIQRWALTGLLLLKLAGSYGCAPKQKMKIIEIPYRGTVCVFCYIDKNRDEVPPTARIVGDSLVLDLAPGDVIAECSKEVIRTGLGRNPQGFYLFTPSTERLELITRSN